MLNLWVSQYFGNRNARDFLVLYGDDVLPALKGDKQVGADYQAAIAQANALSQQRRIFHWDLEFPEVFVDLHKRDWAQNPGFDAVIGNPPYVRVRTLKESGDPSAEYWEGSATFVSAVHVWDVYMLFAEQAQRLARRGGQCSFIVPIQTLHQPNSQALRDLLVQRCVVREVVDLGNVQVFDEAVVKTCILVDSPDATSAKDTVNIRVPMTPDLESSPVFSVPYTLLLQAPSHSFQPDLLLAYGLIVLLMTK